MIEEKLKEIICDYTDIDKNDIKGEMSFLADLGLDSFAVMSMIGVVEETFNVHVEDEDLSTFQTFQDLVNYIEKKTI